MPIPRIACLLPVLPLLMGAALAPSWVAGWTASAHGPYPVGNPTAQPELKFALPAADTASDQSFRLIVRPDVCGAQTRLRLSEPFEEDVSAPVDQLPIARLSGHRFRLL